MRKLIAIMAALGFLASTSLPTLAAPAAGNDTVKSSTQLSAQEKKDDSKKADTKKTKKTKKAKKAKKTKKAKKAKKPMKKDDAKKDDMKK